MIGGDGVEDEIEAAGVLLHLAGVAGDDDAIGVATIGDADQAAGLGDTADDLMAGNNPFRVRQPVYCSSVTCSIQSTALPSSCS